MSFLPVETIVQAAVEAFEETNLFFQDKTIQDINDCTNFPLYELWQGNNEETIGCEYPICVTHNLKIRAWDKFPPHCAGDLDSIRRTAAGDIELQKMRIRAIFNMLIDNYGFNPLNKPQDKIKWRVTKRGRTEKCLYGVEGALVLERNETPICCELIDLRNMPDCGKKKSNGFSS